MRQNSFYVGSGAFLGIARLTRDDDVPFGAFAALSQGKDMIHGHFLWCERDFAIVALGCNMDFGFPPRGLAQ